MALRGVSVLLLASLLTAMAYGEGRTIRPLDDDWRFHLGDAAEAQAPGFDDSQWQEVVVPHDWSIAGPFDEHAPAGGDGGFLPTGVGWYRRHFTVPGEESVRRHFVEFDGVMANSDVWINGQHLGRRPNGYVGFQYELTDHLKFGEAERNVLAVRADTSEQPASRWYTGSGIYRHVRLVSTGPVRIEPWGVFVTTPAVDAKEATVNVAIDVRNPGDDSRKVTVRTRVVDPQGQEVAALETTAEAAARATSHVVQAVVVARPLHWDLDHGHLYTAVTSVVVDGQVFDEVRTPFGIRQIEFRPDTGFWLNGRNLKLKGVCLHHDGGPVGAAVPLSWWRHRLLKLKRLGVNAVRTAHGPVAPEFLDLCDELGFVVMDEFFDCWTIGKRRYDYHRYFREWAHRDASDTILRDRNHPSIVLYSAGNEIRDTPDEALAKEVLNGLIQVFRETDPTRPITQALFRPNVSHDYDNGLADMLDVIGTNYRDVELLEAWREKPTRRIIGTEQGHDRRIWLACRDNPPHAGQFLWVGIDYLGESRRWPVTTFNAGLLDRTGHPHPRALERQSWWSDQPVVAAVRRVAPTGATPTDPGYELQEWERRQVLFPDWTPADLGPHDENVEVYTNCDEAELFLNERSLGRKPRRTDAGPLNWTVPFEPGLLTTVGYKDGREIARGELRTAGPPAKLVVSRHVERLRPARDDVAEVTVRVADTAETTVPTATDRVKFSVEGPGAIVAVDNGSIVDLDPFQASERRAHQGRCMALVRAVGDEGTIVVTSEAEGLESGSVRIEVAPRIAAKPASGGSGHYLFSYFVGNGEDGLHLAHSTDGYRWEAVRGGRSLLTPTTGRDKLMRDPSIVQGPDGTFHMVWTVSWGERGIGYAFSKDLVHWSPQRFLPVMDHEPTALNSWAPELYYDAPSKQFLIVWATTIPGRFPETDGQGRGDAGERGLDHRLYYVTTKDFETFSDTKLFYEQGFNVIDGAVFRADGRYALVLKDETDRPHRPEKNLRLAWSGRLEGPYGPPSAPITGDYWAEGPTVLKIGDKWFVYFDKYIEHKYGLVTSSDLVHWTDESEKLHMPRGMRHGTAFSVPAGVVEGLK